MAPPAERVIASAPRTTCGLNVSALASGAVGTGTPWLDVVAGWGPPLPLGPFDWACGWRSRNTVPFVDGVDGAVEGVAGADVSCAGGALAGGAGNDVLG